MDEVHTIGEKIKQWRKERNISRKELSFLSYTHYTHLMNIENGKANPQMKTLLRILDALDVELEEVILEKNEISEPK